MIIEIFVATASGIGSGLRFIASRFLGMSISNDDINDIVQQEFNAKHSR